MILVTGATGNTGKLVCQELTKRGIPFRGMTRSQKNFSTLQSQNFHPIFGDFDVPETLPEALEGITEAYLVCTPDEKLAEREKNFIQAAKKASLRYLVLCSGFGAGLDAASPNLRNHAVVERELKESNIPSCVIRPIGFLQSLYWMSAPMIAQGIMPYPAGKGRGAYVDIRDVAKAIAHLLLEELCGETYDLTGPQSLSMIEIAEMLSTALRRQVVYVDIPEEQLEMAMAQMGVPEAARQHVAVTFRMIRSGKADIVTNHLQHLGVKPTTCEQFARDLAEGKTCAAGSFTPPFPLPEL